MTGSDGPTAYAYDPVGNRSSMTRGGVTTAYSYDRADRITQAGATAYTVDRSGRTTARGADRFAYDLAHRLTQATVAGQTTTYRYDGAGKRVETARAGAAPERYVYDVNRALPVLLEDGKRKYVWGVGLAHAVDKASGALEVQHADGLGSVRALTDAGGQVTQTYETDEFGGVTRVSGGSDQPFGFTGEQRDRETGLVYLRARYYDPLLGRFLSKDPLRGQRTKPQTQNRYVYAGNNPLTVVDPSGLKTMTLPHLQRTSGKTNLTHGTRICMWLGTRPWGHSKLGRTKSSKIPSP